jgi:hypothetical protein
MADLPQIFMKVEIDPDNLAALNESIEQFKSKAFEMEQAVAKVTRAIQGLEHSFVVKRAEEDD